LKGLPPTSVARTIAADTFNFKRLMQGREAKFRCSLPYHFVDVAIIQFRDRPAFPANQKLSGVWAARVRAANERVEGIQTMDQVGLDQEIQRAVDCRWRHFAASTIQAIKDIVRTDRLVTVPDQLEYPPTLFREAKPALTADSYGSRYGLCHAVLVIVLFAGEGFAGIRSDHFLGSFR